MPHDDTSDQRTVTRQGAGRRVVSAAKDWGTPRKYVDVVSAFFGGKIDLDPCSNGHSIVGAFIEYRLPGHDGLVESWNFPHIFVNPPYGIDQERGTRIGDWLARCAAAQTDHDAEVLALVPVATNTGHWKRHVFGRAAAVCFLSDTRLRFREDGREGGKGAPMACAMVYWGRFPATFHAAFSCYGAVVDLRPLHRCGDDPCQSGGHHPDEA